jgi:hypothetical protein
MTALELKEKIIKKEVKDIDLFHYFQVKNIEGLEMHLFERFKDEKHNNEYLITGFKSIFADLNYETYNPLQEEYMFYFIVTKGIYDFPNEDLNFMIDVLGVFKTLQIMRAILADKDSVKYYKELYKNYLDKTFNVSILVNQGIEKMLKLIDRIMTDLNSEDSKKLFSEIKENVKNIDLKQLLDNLQLTKEEKKNS